MTDINYKCIIFLTGGGIRKRIIANVFLMGGHLLVALCIYISYLSFYLCIYLSIYLSIRLYLSIKRDGSFSVWLYYSLYEFLLVKMAVLLGCLYKNMVTMPYQGSVVGSFHLSIHLSIYPSIYLSTYLFISLWSAFW